MKKVLFYSHNACGPDEIKRTLFIGQILLTTLPGLSLKIITGSSMIGSLRMPRGIECIQLPSASDVAKELGPEVVRDPQRVCQARSEILLRQTVEFQPDLILVDTTPFGVQHELLPVLASRQHHFPQTKMAMILQDVLDGPTAIKELWKKQGYFEAIERHYDQLLVLGSPRVFDPREEYGFSAAISAKTRFLGYMRRSRGLQSAEMVRRTLGIGKKKSLVAVKAVGRLSDVEFFEEYVNGIEQVDQDASFTSLMLLDSDMSSSDRKRLEERAQQLQQVKVLFAPDDVMSYLEAADLVVACGGYQSVCEILTLNKPAVLVPREESVQDQSIRVSRLARLGLITMIHPETLTTEKLIGTIQRDLKERKQATREAFPLSVDALPKLAQAVGALLQLPPSKKLPPFPADEPGVFKNRALDEVMRRFFSVVL